MSQQVKPDVPVVKCYVPLLVCVTENISLYNTAFTRNLFQLKMAVGTNTIQQLKLDYY